jgi:hypothetical protein
MAGKHHKSKNERRELKPDGRLFTFEVCLFSGPVTGAFIEANPVVCRTIEIRADQTLRDLHEAIFDAFDREDEHLYEFQIGGTAPMDPNARRYVLPDAMDVPFDGHPAGSVRERIGDLGLEVNDVFGYWFDFGDDWWHQVNVVRIDQQTPPGRYPQITRRVGNSPAQYLEQDEEEDAWEEDDVFEEEGVDDGWTEDEDEAPLTLEEIAAEVPDRYRAIFDEIVVLIDAFCDTYLNEEYKGLCREMAGVVCVNGWPKPRSKAAGWAAGIVYVIGRINLLDDPTEDPHVPFPQVAKRFGISVATMQANARMIRESLEMGVFEPVWWLPSRLEENSLGGIIDLLDSILPGSLTRHSLPPRPIKSIDPKPQPPGKPRLRYLPGGKQSTDDEDAD